jgi:hypothetical protein
MNESPKRNHAKNIFKHYFQQALGDRYQPDCGFEIENAVDAMIDAAKEEVIKEMDYERPD